MSLVWIFSAHFEIKTFWDMSNKIIWKFIMKQTSSRGSFYDCPLSGSVIGSFGCPDLEDMSGFVPPLFGKPLSPRRNPRAVWRMSFVHSWDTWIRFLGNPECSWWTCTLSFALTWDKKLKPRVYHPTFGTIFPWSSKHAIQNSPGIKKVNFSENHHKCRTMFCNQKNHKTSKSP